MLSFSESEHALRSAAVAVPVLRDVVIADGPEAASYLHGQVSQNVEGLSDGASAWSLLLEPTGRVTSWLRITRIGPETYWLDLDPGAGDATLERLDRFKLRTNATFQLRSGTPSVSIRGPQSPSVSEVRSSLASDGCDAVVVELDWPGSTGIDVLGVSSEQIEPTLRALGVPAGDPAVAELERIEAGRPAMGAEFGEKTIPAEAGVVARSADFTKGCYVGQELVARVDSRGNNTPRTVHPVRLPAGDVPSVGTELTVDGTAVGVITSAAGANGHVAALASIKRGVAVPVTAVVSVGDADVAAEVLDVHWV